LNSDIFNYILIDCWLTTNNHIDFFDD